VPVASIAAAFSVRHQNLATEPLPTRKIFRLIFRSFNPAQTLRLPHSAVVKTLYRPRKASRPHLGAGLVFPVPCRVRVFCPSHPSQSAVALFPISDFLNKHSRESEFPQVSPPPHPPHDSWRCPLLSSSQSPLRAPGATLFSPTPQEVLAPIAQSGVCPSSTPIELPPRSSRVLFFLLKPC